MNIHTISQRTFPFPTLHSERLLVHARWYLRRVSQTNRRDFRCVIRCQDSARPDTPRPAATTLGAPRQTAAGPANAGQMVAALMDETGCETMEIY